MNRIEKKWGILAIYQQGNVGEHHIRKAVKDGFGSKELAEKYFNDNADHIGNLFYFANGFIITEVYSLRKESHEKN